MHFLSRKKHINLFFSTALYSYQVLVHINFASINTFVGVRSRCVSSIFLIVQFLSPSLLSPYHILHHFNMFQQYFILTVHCVLLL